MTDVRHATAKDVGLLARIIAAAFTDDPVMSWVLPESETRETKLRIAYYGLAQGFLPDGGAVDVVDDACASFWRAPDYDYNQPEIEVPPGVEVPFAPDLLERFGVLSRAMAQAHPHETHHWYLAVLGTVPARQGQGLGARVVAPVLEICDAEGIPAYLESSNPRNIPFYERQGFVRAGEIPLPAGPSLYPMWREPAVR